MSKKHRIEVCVNSVESAIHAETGGADRVELCDNLLEGGTTPSFGTILAARKALSLGLHVLIRPRGGDFLYSDLEFEIMKQDIIQAKQAGVDGIVFGILLPDGSIDMPRSKEMADLARPLSVTFHRAFDVTSGPLESLQKLIDLGIDRILTSGQKNKAREGVDLLAQLVQDAGDKIIILVGSGVDEHTLPEIMQKTHALEYHVSAKTKVDSGMTYRNHAVAMGGDPSQSDYEISITDAGRIKRIVQLAKSHII